MTADLLQVTKSGLGYLCVGGFVAGFSMFSLLAKEKLYINEVVLGTALGVIFGPHVAGIFDPRSWGGDTTFITREVTRIVLVIGLFTIGVELPKSYMAKHAKSLLIMVVPTMAIGWVTVASIIFGLFPNLSFFSCLAVAACLTPTDPIICAAIVGGKFAENNVSPELRHILSAESAANDGLAFPFLTIALYFITDHSRGDAIKDWVLIGWLYQVILGTVIGAILGLSFSYLLRFSYKHGFINRESYVVQYLTLAIFTSGLVSTIGSDDLLAAFAAGCAISWDGVFKDHTEGEVFASVIDSALNCGCFVYIGAWLPFASFNSPELGITPWRLAVLLVSILMVRRIPAILILYKWVPEIDNWFEALFTGHFGPMGVGAVFVSSLAVHNLTKPESPPQGEEQLLAACLQPIVAYVVLGSIIIHGLSIPFYSLGKSVTIDWKSGGKSSSKDEEANINDVSIPTVSSQ